jgi:hypothetical protein
VLLGTAGGTLSKPLRPSPKKVLCIDVLDVDA